MFLSFPRVFPYEDVFLLNLKNCIPQYRQYIRLQKNGLPVISGRKQATYGPLSWLLCLLSRTRWLLHPWALKWTPAEQTTHTIQKLQKNNGDRDCTRDRHSSCTRWHKSIQALPFKCMRTYSRFTKALFSFSCVFWLWLMRSLQMKSAEHGRGSFHQQ